MENSSKINISDELKVKFPQDEKISFKILFLICALISQYLGIKNDPLNNLLNNFQEIKSISKQNIQNIINYFYFAKNKIHKILYDEEELINIKFNETKKNISDYFYLDLLINADLNISNYSYSFDFISKINNIPKDKNENLRTIFFAKFIIDLINNYKQLDVYNVDEEKDKLNKIQKENELIFRKNIGILNEIARNISEQNFKAKKIDEIYSEIINSWLIR